MANHMNICRAYKKPKENDEKLTDAQAYELIGERAAEIAKKPSIQKIMVNMIEDGHTKEEVEKWLYMVAIGSLYGRARK